MDHSHHRNETAKGRRKAHRPTAVDLFAGAGGLSLGFEQAGFDVLAAVEYDPVHAAVHSFNFPLTKVLCRDISRLSASELWAEIAEGGRRHANEISSADTIDVIFGGPPCQGFSSIGKRLIDDPRNALVFHFFRIVSELKPRYFVMENVPGMAAAGHARILDTLIEEFEGAGYSVTLPPRILRAAQYGVPQERRRLFLLGARSDQSRVEYPSPTVQPITGQKASHSDLQQHLDIGSSLPIGPSVDDAIRDLPNLDQFDELLLSDEVVLSRDLVRSMYARESTYVGKLRESISDPENYSYKRAWDPNVLTSSMRTEHTALSIERFDRTSQGGTEPVSRFLRLPSDGLSNTLRAGTGSEHGAYTSPRPIHPTFPRVISVREAARLHSFPDWFRFHKTKWHGFRQIGNAVPPLLGRAVGSAIIKSLKTKPYWPKKVLQLGDVSLLSLTMTSAAATFAAEEDEMPRKRARAVSGRGV